MSSIRRALIVLVLALCFPAATAQAGVVGGWIGDPAHDVAGDEGYVAMDDVLAFATAYNSRGRIDVSVRYAAFGRPSDGVHNPNPDFWVYASLGRWSFAKGRCSAPILDSHGDVGPGSGGAPGDAVIGMYEGAAIPHVRATVLGTDGELRHDGLTYDRRVARFSGYVEGGALAKRGYNCVTSALSISHGTVRDNVSPFCMGILGLLRCPRQSVRGWADAQRRHRRLT